MSCEWRETQKEESEDKKTELKTTSRKEKKMRNTENSARESRRVEETRSADTLMWSLHFPIQIVLNKTIESTHYSHILVTVPILMMLSKYSWKAERQWKDRTSEEEA